LKNKSPIRNFLGHLVFFGVVLGLFFVNFGETKVTASFEGSVIDGARVYLDGKYVGKTPYVTRLMPGSHTIKVLPPYGYDTDLVSETIQLFTFGRGIDRCVEFHLLEQGSADVITAETF
jgi:hypothetical protein